MDLLYALVCVFFVILLVLYLRIKKKYIKERENDTNNISPIDLGMVFKTYVVIVCIIIAILYFIFR